MNFKLVLLFVAQLDKGQFDFYGKELKLEIVVLQVLGVEFTGNYIKDLLISGELVVIFVRLAQHR